MLRRTTRSHENVSRKTFTQNRKNQLLVENRGFLVQSLPGVPLLLPCPDGPEDRNDHREHHEESDSEEDPEQDIHHGVPPPPLRGASVFVRALPSLLCRYNVHYIVKCALPEVHPCRAFFLRRPRSAPYPFCRRLSAARLAASSHRWRSSSVSSRRRGTTTGLPSAPSATIVKSPDAVTQPLKRILSPFRGEFHL